jgi:lysophospholipid acyltransferase (LPLAT)-like uncharacterized protein
MKRLLKRLLKSDGFHAFLAWVGAWYVRLVLATSKMHSHLHPDSLPYFNSEHPALFVVWHSRVMLMQSHDPRHYPHKNKGRVMRALVSRHSDGRMIGRVLEHFGIGIVHGSTSKGGAAALRILVQEHRAGCNLSITPDGPRGPARVASDGVAQLAMLTGAPVVCVSYAASRHKRLRSWDGFILALPFSRLYFLSSAPILFLHIAGEDKASARERLRVQIEETLNRITDAADGMVESV